MKRNIVLIGFMGTGKTTLGQQVAERLQWRFVDSDAWIEEQEAMRISEMFETKGESTFRTLETEALRTILRENQQVVATGGGAVLAPENRDIMLERAIVIALRADVATIVERVSQDSNRPLVQGDVHQKVSELMARREHAYDFAHVTIDTGKLSLTEATEQIITHCEPLIR